MHSPSKHIHCVKSVAVPEGVGYDTDIQKTPKRDYFFMHCPLRPCNSNNIVYCTSFASVFLELVAHLISCILMLKCLLPNIKPATAINILYMLCSD